MKVWVTRTSRASLSGRSAQLPRPKANQAVEVLDLGIVGAEVRRRVQERVDRVLELAEPTVAVEAQDAAHRAVVVAVVDVLWRFLAADRAHTTLLCDQRIKVVRADPVAALQVVVTTAPVKSFTRFARACVIALFAIAVKAVLAVLVSRKLGDSFVLLAVGAPLPHSCSVRLGYDSYGLWITSLTALLYVRFYEFLCVGF
jgi:hypothetical protein